jgi:hypothetical protein
MSHPSKTDTAAIALNATPNHTSRECKSAECCAFSAACTEPALTPRPVGGDFGPGEAMTWEGDVRWTVFEGPCEVMWEGEREAMWTVAAKGKLATKR